MDEAEAHRLYDDIEQAAGKHAALAAELHGVAVSESERVFLEIGVHAGITATLQEFRAKGLL